MIPQEDAKTLSNACKKTMIYIAHSDRCDNEVMLHSVHRGSIDIGRWNIIVAGHAAQSLGLTDAVKMLPCFG